MAKESKTREHFVDNFCEDFLCSICLCIPFPEHAVETTCCGNFFCSSCLQRCRQTKEICPNCNGDLTSDKPRPIQASKFAMKKLLGLVVYCDTNFSDVTENPDIGTCEWKGTWGDLSSHLNKCEFVNVNCSWENCTQIFPRKFAENHELECDFRTVLCRFCETNLPYNTLERHHQLECNLFPEKCEQCNQTEIPRQDIQNHISQDCVETLIDCDISGCPERIARKDMELHKSECIHRVVPCEFCTIDLPFLDHKEHHEIDCEEILIDCPHKCGIDKMARKILADHEVVCSFYPLQCTFNGCNKKVLRSELNQHIQDSMAYHFSILCEQMAILNTRLDRNEAELASKDEQIQELTTQLKNAQTQIETLQNQSVFDVKYGPIIFKLTYGTGSEKFYFAGAEWKIYLGDSLQKFRCIFIQITSSSKAIVSYSVNITGTESSEIFEGAVSEISSKTHGARIHDQELFTADKSPHYIVGILFKKVVDA